MPNLSNLKAEISSVKDIRKITGAMELVATAKLKKVTKKIGESKVFIAETYSLFNDIINNADKSVFLKSNSDEIKKTLYVVVNSNLGLCGGYNSNLNKIVIKEIKPEDEVIAVGSKAVSYYKNKKIKIKDKILNVDVNFDQADASMLANQILEEFTSKKFDEIKIAYTKFINNVTFEPTILRVFPIIKEKNINQDHVNNAIVEFEPDPESVLETSLTMYLNVIVYGTIIESQLSEQASRRTAMEAANKNGKDLTESLSVLFNKKRQDAITQEITEIVSGANAQNS